MIVAFLLLLVTVGSVVFHLLSPWWWTPIASNWGYIDDTINLTFAICGVVWVALLGFTAYCVYRFQAKPGHTAHYEPENTKLEWWLSILTGLGVVAMLTPGLFVWQQFITVPENADEFEVLGQQWLWSYRFPGKDGQLGKSDPRNVTPDNPFGINPGDPAGQDDVLVQGDDLHLPLDRPVKVLLRSLDVLHDFYVPQFRAKMDMIPGMVTYFWLTPTRTGAFDILCAELCGVGHHEMRGIVIVEEEAAYRAWLAEQPTFAQSLAKVRAGAKHATNLTAVGAAR